MQDIQVGSYLRLYLHGKDNYTLFNIREERGRGAWLVNCCHGSWEGIYDPEMSVMIVLGDSYGWRSEEDRVMNTIFNVAYEVIYD